MIMPRDYVNTYDIKNTVLFRSVDKTGHIAIFLLNMRRTSRWFTFM